MYKEINENQFIDEFNRCRPNQFSHQGLQALFNYFEENEPNKKLDIVEICSEWSEYETLEEFQRDNCGGDYPTFNEVEYDTEIIYVDNESFITRNF